MFTRILTAVERKKIRAYLKADGKKERHIAVIATRAKHFIPTIKLDLELLEKFLDCYATKV